MSASISRCRRSLGLLVVAVAALVALPGAAGAADAVVAPGAVAQRMTALDGHLVWIAAGGRKLMHRGADGAVGPVVGAPAATYRSIDLGHDAGGDLVLTYLSCIKSTGCRAWSDDLHGHRSALKIQVPKRCQLTAAPSLWGKRVAYGLFCWTLRGEPGMPSARRSGLFVRSGAGAPKRAGLPASDDPSDAEAPRWVDLRGTHVAASTSGLNSEGAYVKTVNGTQRRETGRGWDEGGGARPLAGMALSADGVLWLLHENAGDDRPSEADLIRLAPGCESVEVLTHAPGPEQRVLPAAALAVDGTTIYLEVPGTGIVAHDFGPGYTCPPPDASAVPRGTSIAGDPVLVAGAVAPRMTALDGVVVWITGSGSSGKLMQRTAGGTIRPVKGAPVGSYRSIDLGRDAKGKLVLTYLRCTTSTRCNASSDDLHGRRTPFKHLVPNRCALTAAPAVWRDRVAYGLSCSRLHGKAGVRDAARSGLFVRKGSGAAKHAGLTARARKDERRADTGLWVDLRGTHIAGSTAGADFLGAYTQRLDGKNLRFAGYGWMPGVDHLSLEGLSLGASGVLWTLYHDDEEGPETIINRLGLSCNDPGSDDFQILANLARPAGYAAESIAVDGGMVYVYVRGTGIVTHTYVPALACD
jgi:hypothetical protein